MNVMTMNELESVIRALLHKYHAEYALLFGSYARGEATADSDIDVVVFIVATRSERKRRARQCQENVRFHPSVPPRSYLTILISFSHSVMPFVLRSTAPKPFRCLVSGVSSAIFASVSSR